MRFQLKSLLIWVAVAALAVHFSLLFERELLFKILIAGATSAWTLFLFRLGELHHCE